MNVILVCAFSLINAFYFSSDEPEKVAYDFMHRFPPLILDLLHQGFYDASNK